MTASHWHSVGFIHLPIAVHSQRVARRRPSEPASQTDRQRQACPWTATQRRSPAQSGQVARTCDLHEPPQPHLVTSHPASQSTHDEPPPTRTPGASTARASPQPRAAAPRRVASPQERPACCAVTNSSWTLWRKATLRLAGRLARRSFGATSGRPLRPHRGGAGQQGGRPFFLVVPQQEGHCEPTRQAPETNARLGEREGGFLLLNFVNMWMRRSG